MKPHHGQNSTAIIFDSSILTAPVKHGTNLIQQLHTGSNHVNAGPFSITPHSRVLYLNSQCGTEPLKNQLLSFRQQKVDLHCVFQGKSFHPVLDSKRLASILHCYLAVLEVIAKDKLVSSFDLYVHLLHDADTSYIAARSTKRHKYEGSCYFSPFYKDFQNVFLKSIQLYTNVYQTIYNFNVFYVIN